MTELEEKLKAKCDRLSLKLSDALKKVSRLSLGQEAPRRLQDILCSATFHLGIAMRQYEQMLADPSLDEKNRKLIEGQRNDCAELKQLFDFIRIPEKGEKI